MTKPPHQHNAETSPAFLGPARSSHLPHTAADEPKKTKKRVYIHPNMEMSQSNEVEKILAKKPMSAGAGTDAETPSDFDRGSQKTEKPYAIPMHK